MWVAELGCDLGHRFEGWFGSRDDFVDQQRRGLVSCPTCGSHAVDRCLSAPRLNLGAAAPVTPRPSTEEPLSLPDLDATAVLRSWMAQVRAQTEDVGGRFAEEVRRIHAQEAPERPIRGRASLDQVAELRDEGIEVWPLPLPDSEATPH
ncbi:MAG: DUF1178 family protein [Inhella sp.]|jgi:hypothetical protein|uniref:DUF1178 family protein n=1 Tax=Inhella sp. TaxID=1921806 RepID=UPI0022C92F92|nr:DUF1178 family protein [Inhella sp.]MCZ8236057.1 DUF1178 family protein [Inhella sp.]